MAEPKTKPTDASVTDFVGALTDPKRREACEVLIALLDDITGEKPVMWGTSIVGYGRYITQTKPPAPWPLIGFSPRAAAMTVYIMGGLSERRDLMEGLGKYTTEGGCLYFKRISDIDRDRLKALLTWGYETMKARHPG